MTARLVRQESLAGEWIGTSVIPLGTGEHRHMMLSVLQNSTITEQSTTASVPFSLAIAVSPGSPEGLEVKGVHPYRVIRASSDGLELEHLDDDGQVIARLELRLGADGRLTGTAVSVRRVQTGRLQMQPMEGTPPEGSRSTIDLGRH